MKEKLIFAAVIVLFAAGAVGAWVMFRPENNENFPQGTRWMCPDKACGHQFALTVRDLARHHDEHYGEPVPCPKCRKPATRAIECPHCKAVSPLGRDMLNCPKCKKPIDVPV